MAQILQAQPKLTPAEVKFALQYTAQRLKGFGLIEQGAGSLNVALAAAAVKSQELIGRAEHNQIGGETVEAGHTAFGAGGSAYSIILGFEHYPAFEHRLGQLKRCVRGRPPGRDLPVSAAA